MERKRVLVIEDDAGMREMLTRAFEQAGYEVNATALGAEGMHLARMSAPHVVLLDLMLGDVSGEHVCRALKGDEATQHLPIVMVTAKGEEIDRVVGFELGAADYVVKPFSVRELVLRVRAVLQRREDVAAHPGFGSLRIDRGSHRAWAQGREVELTPLEFDLVAALLDRRGHVVTREELRVRLKQKNGGANGTAAADEAASRAIDTHVKRVRDKLGEVGGVIETVRGIGYRLNEEAK
jgi:two-component system phosphate regulon response regulator PhoB